MRAEEAIRESPMGASAALEIADIPWNRVLDAIA
jgi:hypothetical protein